MKVLKKNNNIPKFIIQRRRWFDKKMSELLEEYDIKEGWGKWRDYEKFLTKKSAEITKNKLIVENKIVMSSLGIDKLFEYRIIDLNENS